MKQMILTALMCAVAVPYSAVALHISVEDFELLAVQGNTFYGYSNNLTDREILFLPTISDQNHLAVDPDRNRILFLQNEPLGPAHHILWEYDSIQIRLLLLVPSGSQILSPAVRHSMKGLTTCRMTVSKTASLK